MNVQTMPRVAGARETEARRRFRPDIQGLRAVAVGAVLLFHANAPFLPGGFIGVDVFFVISGFLITGILLREAQTRGRINLPGFYAKRARRILPAATVALVATAALSFVFLPDIRWRGIGTEISAASVSMVNWVLAAGTDYLNADIAASPVQHFWTLAVEEQFYIILPVLFVALLWVSRRWVDDQSSQFVQRVLQLGVSAILLASLAWSVTYTAIAPAPAYFVTTTRLWELAIGAAVAVFATHLERLPDGVGRVLGWAGLLGVLAACLVFSSDTPFPGSAALLPTLSAAALIIGGMGGRAGSGAGRLLAVRPMRWLGDISYSLYLWHWPLIVIATYLLGGELRFRYGALVAILSLLPAWLSYRFIENPFRDWKWAAARSARALWMGSALVVISALLGGLLAFAPASSPVPKNPLGAAALETDQSAGVVSDTVPGGFVPSAVAARDDNPIVYANGCHADQGKTVDPGCTLGAADGDVTIALVGDSHAANWVPALDAVAQEQGWRLRVFTKSSCAFANIMIAGGNGKPYVNCQDWNRKVLNILAEEQPALVITANAAGRSVWDEAPLSAEESAQAFSQGLHRTWTRLEDQGIPVVAIRDVPDMGIDIPECVSANPDQLSSCSRDRSLAVDDRPYPEPDAAAGISNASVIDMNAWICPTDRCPAVIGNVLIWRDNQHLTATYARSLAAPLLNALQEDSTAARVLVRSR
ncbi:acyltransferase family protein [Leucobacter sp. NPDC058333]|uniref:acyltransferase family protein n=1 Tax=Leucobacter sp. NPDC058333 TaxID=3346450 RepID=UPI00364E3AAF